EEFNSADAGNSSGVGRVDGRPKVWVVEVPTKAWPLFPHHPAANARWRRRCRNRLFAGVHLHRAANNYRIRNTRGLSIIETTTIMIIIMIVAAKHMLVSRMFFFILILIGCFR
ncbi:hypothetical protein TorRG33x02_349070, partial [Trema orientale]